METEKAPTNLYSIWKGKISTLKICDDFGVIPKKLNFSGKIFLIGQIGSNLISANAVRKRSLIGLARKKPDQSTPLTKTLQEPRSRSHWLIIKAVIILLVDAFLCVCIQYPFLFWYEFMLEGWAFGLDFLVTAIPLLCLYLTSCEGQYPSSLPSNYHFNEPLANAFNL